MRRFFLDANTLVSGLAFRGPEARLLLEGERGACVLTTSEYVLSQVLRVLLGKLGLSEPLVRNALAALPLEVADAPSTAGTGRAELVLRDPTDAPVLAAAWESGADALVTGDKDLLVLADDAELPVIRATEALALLERDSDADE